MDPDAALEEIRRITNEINHATNDADAASWASQLVDVIDGLDNWVTKGGALPQEWSKNR